jgi:hypothetical protein
MQAHLNGNIGSITDIKVKEDKKPFFVLSVRDTNQGPNAPESSKWATVFVRADSIERLVPLHGVVKVGHYVSVSGQVGANINIYEGKVGANLTLNTTPGGLTLMGAPLGTGKPESAPADAGEPADKLQPASVGGGGADLDPDDNVGF